MFLVGYCLVIICYVNEGQGDLLMVGERVLVGYGFCIDQCVYVEIVVVFGLLVVFFELVDLWFYYLDIVLVVFDDYMIVYYLLVFSMVVQEQLLVLFFDVIVVGSVDVFVFGFNVVFDGLNVVFLVVVMGFVVQLCVVGFELVGVDLFELFKGGGFVKCCMLEIYL